LLVGTVAVLVVIVTIPWARHTVSAFLRFAAENGAINTTANDIPWPGIPDVPAPSPEVITSSLLFSGLKFGWIAIALLAFAMLANAASVDVRSLARVRNRLLWAVGLSCVFMLPWTAGRIDPGMSRTGTFSAYCAAVFLPVIVTRFRMPRTALFVVIAAVLGLYASETGMVSAIRLVAVRLSPVISVPNNLVRVIGSEHGLPNLGTIYISPDKLDELTHFNGEVSRFAGDRGTYFDLSNRQALYSFCRRKSPTMYPASYVAASYQQQEHMLAQLKADAVKVVFVSPAMAIDGPASLRSYLLYRYAVLNFRPCLVRGDLFMLDESVDRAQCEAVADLTLLDGAFSFWQLYGLPSAWGASWASLQHLFDKWPVPSFASRVRAEGRVAPGLKRPFIWVTLQDLNINPQQYDFLTFRFSCDSCALTKIPLQVRWKSNMALSKPIALTVEGDRVLLPMGSYPQWLTAQTITALRLELDCEGCARSFQVSDLTLLHYKPAEIVPNALGEKMTGQKTTSRVVSDAIIKGVIDAPKEGATVSRDFLVGGWAVADGGSIKDVVISVDGKPPMAAGPSVPRPDVAAVFPDVPDAVDSGWTLIVPIRDMQAGKHQVAVTVRLRDGAEESLGTVNVTVVK
jgi:Bacterial Ig domain